MNRLSDIYIDLGFCKSKKEFKRLAAAGAIRVNGMPIHEDLEALHIAGALTFGLHVADDCYTIPPTLHNKHDTDWLIIKRLPL